MVQLKMLCMNIILIEKQSGQAIYKFNNPKGLIVESLILSPW